ncbi:MAG: GAF domain-containing protein [Anaerolineae bacterium]|nr:GAF domain-containing protein [Anaerolineae bacterium]
MLGAILIGYTNPHSFTGEEKRLFEVLGAQVAVQLQNLLLLDETQTALIKLDYLNRRLTGQGWQEYTERVGDLVAEATAPGQSAESLPVEHGEVFQVPVSVRGEVIGHFNLTPGEAGAFSEEDRLLLYEIANEVSSSLENMRLIEQTQRNAADLEESRNLLDAIIDNLPMLMFVKDAQELRYVRWNKAGEDMLGLRAEDVLGKNAYDSFPKDEADRFTAQDWEILSGESFLDISEETVQSPKGERILHTRKTPVYGPDGSPRYLVGLSEDITERKQAENALLELESLYRRAIASADAVPYSRQYSDDAFTFVGERIEDLTGYSVEEFTADLFDHMIVETVVHSLGGEDRSSTVQMNRSGTMAHWKADYRIRTRDGKERWLADTSVEVLGPDGTSTGSVGIFTDITNRKVAEAALSRQLAEMEYLNAIGQILATQTDLIEMVNLAGEKMCETFKVDTGYIALYDPRSEIVHVPFYVDFGERIALEPQPLGVGLASRVIQTRQPVFISEMTEEIANELGAYIVADKIPASWLAVPILRGAEAIGVISVQHASQPHWFKESDVRLLTTVAASLSTAIQNSRLLEQTQSTLSELEQLTRRLTREGWEEYLSSISAEVGYMYDLTNVAPISAKTDQNGSGFERPLVIQGEPIGRLVVAETEELDEEAAEILTAVSVQLSAHLENLRLLEETERGRIQLDKRAAELATVAEVGTASATILNPDELLQTVVDLTKSSFGLYHAHIYLINETEDALILSNGSGEAGYQMVIEGWQIPLSNKKSLVAQAARTHQGVVAFDVQQDADYLPNPLLPNTRSELAVPIVAGDKVLGVLDVQADRTGYFTDEDTRIYTTLASQIAVALQNARLYVEQAATVQRLRELDHLKSSFLANMSHELRTPLNSIIGFTEIILEGIDGPLTEYMDGDLRIIQKNGRHLLSLINDVLDMAKIEAGRMSLSYERFTLQELLEDVVDITSSLAQNKNLDLTITPTDALETEIVADRIRLRQVLINVVGNAIKFTEVGGVTLHSETKDGKLWVKIKDTGMGIPEENLETIFDHFSQVDTSTTRKAGGTGLGLPISRRLVELHEGRLWAESAGIPGEGSTVNLVLPINATIPVQE